MPVIKSTGVTPTERILADFCERSFLKLWSYPNPFKEDGRLLGNADLLRGRSAVQEMATEPRYFRRALSQRVVDAINTFPDNPDQLTRKLSYFPSSQPGNGYVFLQLRVDVAMRAEPSISVQLL